MITNARLLSDKFIASRFNFVTSLCFKNVKPFHWNVWNIKTNHDGVFILLFVWKELRFRLSLRMQRIVFTFMMNSCSFLLEREQYHGDYKRVDEALTRKTFLINDKDTGRLFSLHVCLAIVRLASPNYKRWETFLPAVAINISMTNDDILICIMNSSLAETIRKMNFRIRNKK